MLALILAITGSALLVGSVLTLRQKRSDKGSAEPEWHAPLCDAPSPDNQLTCDLEIGHWGWHQNENHTWFGDAWDIDHWADTQQKIQVDPDPTMSATEWQKTQNTQGDDVYEVIGVRTLTRGDKRRMKRGIMPRPRKIHPTREPQPQPTEETEKVTFWTIEGLDYSPWTSEVAKSLGYCHTVKVKNRANLIAYGDRSTKFQYTTTERKH
jgi:hypothetical protein